MRDSATTKINPSTAMTVNEWTNYYDLHVAGGSKQEEEKQNYFTIKVSTYGRDFDLSHTGK